MEYLRIQDKIIAKLGKEMPEINFRNIKTIPVINFDSFLNKSKREFIDWYMNKIAFINFNVNLTVLNDKELLLFEEVCESLGYGFVLQYNTLKGFSVHTYSKIQEPSVSVLEKAVEALQYFGSAIGDSQKVQWIFGSHKQRAETLFFIQRFVYEDVMKVKEDIVSALNKAKVETETAVYEAFKTVLSTVYEQEIKKK
ncbi:hypothetical protein ACFC4S_27120 [Priestia megaterium]|uniref:hypothetical protein n=1 Tax=Priestia megaterium TaxID=1404 RepID=UPI001DA539BC|nr:hypothetical protein [Priestia megaterium]